MLKGASSAGGGGGSNCTVKIKKTVQRAGGGGVLPENRLVVDRKANFSLLTECYLMGHILPFISGGGVREYSSGNIL